jgi:hypothetical protein
MARRLTWGCAPSPTCPHRGHLKDGSADVPPASNLLQHRVQVIAQFDHCVEGHALMPLGTQPLNQFREPHPLHVTCGHV